MSIVNQHANRPEQFDVSLLGRAKREGLKVRNHLRNQIRDATHLELQRFVRPIWPNVTTTLQLSHFVQQLGPIPVLANRKTRSYFPAEAMPLTGDKGNTKASFAVDETRNVGVDIHQQVPESAFYGGPFDRPSEGINPQVVTGKAEPTAILPSVLPTATLTSTGLGFTDLS